MKAEALIAVALVAGWFAVSHLEKPVREPPPLLVPIELPAEPVDRSNPTMDALRPLY